MVKANSRNSRTIVKTEEVEDKSKLKRLLHGTTNTSRNKNKITKYKIVETWIDIKPRFINVQTDNAKSNDSEFGLKPRKKPKITDEKIKELIGYITNDRMSIKAASKKVGMGYMTAQLYYRDYQHDPEHKIPVRKTLSKFQEPIVTQQKINDLIHYIVDEKMKMSRASKKARIGRGNAAKYYAKYLEDKDRKIPKLDIPPDYYTRRCTQKQINDLIDYIVNSNMSLGAAAKKVNMASNTAKRYYFKYLNNPNHEIPAPGKFDVGGGKICTDEEVKTLIHCIVNEGMTLLQAAVKSNMGKYSASKYYRQYLKDPDHKIPTPEADNNNNKKGLDTRHTPDQVKAFFTYVIIDRLNISHASRKANMSEHSGSKYYRKLLEYPNNEGERIYASYTPEKMKNLVKYIQNDKMSFSAAAKKADIAYSTAHKYYQQYLNDPQHNIHKIKTRRYTLEEVKRLIDYIEHDKMTMSAASKLVNMENSAARRYYILYKNDPEHKIPVPRHIGRRKKYDCSQIIADIYRENPTIKPIHEDHCLKLEPLEMESTVASLKIEYS